MISRPILGVGWDVGGWLGEKQAVTVIREDETGPGWCGRPREFKITSLDLAGGGPLALVRQGYPSAEDDLLERYRLVIAIGAPLGFPTAFRRLLAGKVPGSTNPPREIDSPFAYRDTERYIYGTFRKKPLSAVFDKLGNNATVALAHVCRWRDEYGVRVIPFQERVEDRHEIIEVYPGLVKIGGKSSRRHARFGKLLPRRSRSGTDAYDASIAVVLALAYGLGGRDPELPPIVGPAGKLNLEVSRTEGWIFHVPGEWFRQGRQQHYLS